MEREPSATIGEIIDGRYRVERLLGQGGMGEVFEALELGLERMVAIKFLRPELASDEEVMERFRREAKSAAALGHPNIAAVYALGEGSRPHMVMEALRGRNLKEILVQDGPQPGPRVADIACQVLSALGTAHRTGIIHRDIKPANIFVCEGGPVPSQAKLLDFGIAKLLSQKRLTREGLMLGTLSYVSPEQARGTPVDPRSDLFSLGVSMFEALAGQKPFGGLRDTDVLQRILSGTRKSLDEVAPHLDPGLVEIVERALCRSPGDRYESAEAMADALADHVPKKVSARPAPKPDPEPAPESLPKTRRW